MRIGIRSAISALVLTSIVVSAVGVHLLWWRTAQQVSQTLADTINDQIVSAVGDELQSITHGGAVVDDGGADAAGRKSVRSARDARKREFVFLSQLLSQPTISWVAFAWPDGSFFAGHKLGDAVIEMLEISGDRKMRINRYEFEGNDLKLKSSRVEDTEYSVTDQEWFRDAIRHQRRTLVDVYDASHRRTAGRGLRGADRDRPEARRRHRHHHRTDAGLEFPVAAHGRKVGRRLHPRPRRRCGRGTRSGRQRGEGAEDRSSAVSGRGGRDAAGRQRLRSRREASRFTRR